MQALLEEIGKNIDFSKSHKAKCDMCEDMGFIFKQDEQGYTSAKECECQIKSRKAERERRRLEEHIEKSNLKPLLEKYTFENFNTEHKGAYEIKKRAREFLEDNSWWVIGGNVGCGKTHITTAICGELMRRGKAVYYMNWKAESIKLKTTMTQDSYQQHLDRLCSVEVLYIDDLLKGSIREADIDLLFMIIDARYSRNLKTLISSEKVFEELKKIDEAIQSRIFEMTKPKYWIQVSKLESYRQKARKR